MTFPTLTSAGGLLPADLLNAAALGELPGGHPADYGLPDGETVREAANRSWNRLEHVWQTFRRAVPADVPGHHTEATRSRWLRVLFEELGYGRLPAVPPGGLGIAGTNYPLSHMWQRTPLHLLGTGVSLDHRTAGVPGAARQAPHSMMQELLNRSPEHLWGVLTNGLQLRLLRDSASLVRQRYVEFDLAAMFDGKVFADFVLLWHVCHASRVEPHPDPSAAPETCWLERWREEGAVRETRALARLSSSVTNALETLGRGFLAATPELRQKLRDGSVTPTAYHRLLLDAVYQIIVLFVAEDRDLLHYPTATAEQRRRYTEHFSTARLRRRAQRHHSADRHTDLWAALQLITRGLGTPAGIPQLGLPGLGGINEPAVLGPLNNAVLTNRDLLKAIHALSVVRDGSGLPRRVDYRNLGFEELGGIYESLLEYEPTYNPSTGAYTLTITNGSSRRTHGSYSTPRELIDVLLDETLDAVLRRAERQSDPEATLLAITVCDPACGSGRFLVAAGWRIARRLAVVRSGEVEPPMPALQTAMRDVVSRCLYGVDIDSQAARLTKVSLWIEALVPGRPFSFLNAHVKVGNAILGTAPELVTAGLPDAALTPLPGDDPKTAATFKRRNRTETANAQQQEIHFDLSSSRDAFRSLAAAPEDTLDDVEVKTAAWHTAETDANLSRARLAADAWCSAFVWPLQPPAVPALTAADIRRVIDHGETALTASQLLELRRLRDRYQFFHWPLEFPDVLPGGFACVIGNPPWERIKLQEQEFFAASAPEIAGAANAAARKKLIAALADDRPALWREYRAALRDADGEGLLARRSGRYPLTGSGDINTYALFAETAIDLVADHGRTGMILPTGIATGDTTAPFFRHLVETNTLAALLDFENEAKLFADVHNQFRFALLAATGGQPVDAASFAFSTRHLHQLAERRFALQPAEILRVNPNSGTSPVFRSRTDAEITIGIHRRVPILWRDGDPDGNPWGLTFTVMFHMANDSRSFRTEKILRDDGWQPHGNAFVRDGARMLPLYEAKMLHHYDSRYGTYRGQTQAQANKGVLPRLTAGEHDDPDVRSWPRYWVTESEVDEALDGRWNHHWLLGWRDIARSVDERTMIATVMPRVGVGHKFPLALPTGGFAAGLQGNLSALVLDYCLRQKLSSASVIFSTVRQLPVLAPSAYDSPASWDRAMTLGRWVTTRVLELSYTGWDLEPYAGYLDNEGPPFRWDDARRAQLRAELDAAYFQLYGLGRGQVEHVLDSFFVLRKNEERQHGEFRTRRLVLAVYDQMAEGAFTSPLDPPPGHGPRHPDRSTDA